MTPSAPTTGPVPAPPLSVLRPDDLLVLTFRFDNVALVRPDGTASPTLVPGGTPTDPPLVIMELPPQAVGEGTFDVTVQSADLAATGNVPAKLSAPSRLVFALTPGGDPIEYTLEALLKACHSRLRVLTGGPDDFEDGHPYSTAPRGTSLEVPFGVVLTPGSGGEFHHATTPVRDKQGTRSELWHTRLDGDNRLRTLAAPRRLTDPDSLPMSPEQRTNLVQQGSGDQPPEADLLLLSALGAWLRAGHDWPAGSQVESWRQRMTMGRDHYVRIVESGYLFPLGNEAVHVTVTERKLDRHPEGTVAAYLRKREYIIVRQPEKSYAGDHRQLPFTKVRLTTLVTPEIHVAGIKGKGTDAFWPQVGPGQGPHQDFRFHVVATGHDGREVEFAAPLAFIARNVAEGSELRTWMFPPRPGDPNTEDFLDEKPSRRVYQLGRQRLAFAPANAAGPAPSDTAFDTASIEVGAQADGDGPFRPFLRAATAFVPAIREATGQEDPVTFGYHPAYVESGSHPLDAFAELANPISVAFPSRPDAGGLVTPKYAVKRLSRTLGPLGPPGSGTTAEAAFDPKAFFGGEGPKLLGVFALADIVPSGQVFGDVTQVFPQPTDPNVPPPGPKIPRLATVRDPAAGLTLTRLHWETPLDEDTFGTGATLVLDVARENRDGAHGFTAHGELRSFAVQVPPDADKALIKVPFTKFAFTAQSGRKVDVAAILGTVEFLGPLAFVNTLSSLLDTLGFSDPPAVTVTDSDVQVGYSLGIPSVPVGAFLLQNLALSAGLVLPLLGEESPKLCLAFAARENPCIVTYSALGGGAFLAVKVGMGGIEALEGSIEFGGAMAMNLGVASGGVSLTAGVYYSAVLTGGAQDFTLAGFVRCVGCLEVLGIISISVQFYLELHFFPDPEAHLTGTASLTVKVKVVFFSKSVTLTVQRKFGSGSDPTFADVMPQRDLWQQYCDAFERSA